MMLALCLLQPPTLSAEKQAAIAEVLKPWRTEDGPGGVVAIYHNGEIVMQEGLGLADLEQGTRLTPESRIDIGSITKQFVVASIVRLELEGKLSQEDSIRKHIPELPEWVEAIKLHHLIHHTSGLRDYLNMSVMSNGGDLNHTPDPDELIEDPDELIEMMKKQRETNFPIGAAAMYCNTGYALLAEVVKRTEKTDLTTATRRLVWEPLGMKDSLYDASADLLVKQRANSYVRNGQGFLAMRLRASIVGDGGMLTTTGDMAKWSRFLATPTEAERPWHEAMLKPSPRPFGPGMRYAGGLFAVRGRAVPRQVGHGHAHPARRGLEWVPRDVYGVPGDGVVSVYGRQRRHPAEQADERPDRPDSARPARAGGTYRPGGKPGLDSVDAGDPGGLRRSICVEADRVAD